MHSPVHHSVGHFVRLRREELGKSARSTSLEAGQSGSYVTKLESGTIEPSLKAFSRLAAVLGFTPSEIWAIVACEATRS